VLSRLLALRQRGEAHALLETAVRERRNIVVCGGTATGKTTVVNALIKEIPRDERLVLIEDAAELFLEHPNAVGMIAVKGELGEARVTVDDLLQASLRMRPDRIIIGELRGKEALTFVRAANSGHPGSLTTVHADSPAGALRQMAMMMVQSGVQLSRSECEGYVRDVVDVWVQLSRVDGVRTVSQIAFRSEI
jgi:type IV secretion system protein VirB11